MKFSTICAIVEALDAADVRYLVAGGVAVNAHGYQRLTQDLDLILNLVPANTRAALKALQRLGYQPILPVSLEAFVDPEERASWIDERNLQVFSLTSDRHPDTTVDLLAAEPFDFNTEYESAMVSELAPGLEVRFVRLATLIGMKEATGRPRDADDAQHLRWILEELSGGGTDE